MQVYIRFSEDIYADIDRGHSFDFRDGSKLPGLCAWKTSFDTRMNSEEEILEGCKKFAAQVSANSYGGYSSDSEVHIITGDYAGSSNDGTCISNVNLIESFSI